MDCINILPLILILCSHSTVMGLRSLGNLSTINDKTGVDSLSNIDDTIPSLDQKDTKRDPGAILTQRLLEQDKKTTNSTKFSAKDSLHVYNGKDRGSPLDHSATAKYPPNKDSHLSDNFVTEEADSIPLTHKHTPLSDWTEGDSEELRKFRNDGDFWKDYGNHRDHFKCDPCNCSRTSNDEVHVKATCQLQGMDDIPKNLSNHLWSLEVFRTSLNRLNVITLLQYSTLNEVNITRNKRLSTVDLLGDVTNVTSQVTKLWLISNKIEYIEDRSFSIFPLLQILSLHDNNLHNLTNGTFDMLVNLRSLDLSHNKINVIELGAFRQLKNLKSLDLGFNKVLNYTSKYFPLNLFAPLKKLEELSIQGHARLDFKYPDIAISQLISLKYLRIDGLNTFFGIAVKSLKYFNHITITTSRSLRNCHLKNLTSNFFTNLPHLTSLEIDTCPLSDVDPSAYKQLNLTSLSLSYLPNYDLYKAFDDLSSFQNSTLKNISFVHLYHSSFSCRVLNKTHAKYLQNIALEVLDLTDNRLALLGEDFAQSLPLTLRSLILKNNRFALSALIVRQVSHLTQLIEIDISAQNQPEISFCTDDAQENNFPKESQTGEDNNTVIKTWGKHSSPDFAGLRYRNDSLDDENVNETKFTDDEDSDSLRTGFQARTISLPPNLRFLKASQYFSLGTVLLQNSWSKNKLLEIDFSKCFLTNWGEGYIHHHVTKIDLSENYCKHIENKFFQPNNSLIYLDMHNNALGADFADDINGAILAELYNLKYLDISYNQIFIIPSKFFKGLKELETLKLVGNKLQILNTTFSRMPRLRYLDLSKNNIIWISEKVRNDLDQIGDQLLVDLSLNPLPCTCAAIEVLNWMANTKVELQKKYFLQCRFENGEIESLGDLEQRVSSLKRMCASKTLVIVICVASMVVVGIFVGCGLIYKNRWKLRYLLNTTKARLFGFKPKGEMESSFKFDAYFIYTDQTRSFVLQDCIQELEEKRGHKLCVEDRDFMPGSPIIADILSGVRNSHKTVPVITPDFYNDGDFTEYSVKMASMEENYERRQVLHLCILEPTDHKDMDNDLLAAMKRNSYTEYPPLDQANEDLIQSFWVRLSSKIGHTALSDIWDKVME